MIGGPLPSAGSVEHDDLLRLTPILFISFHSDEAPLLSMFSVAMTEPEWC